MKISEVIGATNLNRNMDTEQNNIFILVQQILANYRDGQGAAGIFRQLDKLSIEWERLNLPCPIPKHGRRDRLSDIDPGF